LFLAINFLVRDWLRPEVLFLRMILKIKWQGNQLGSEN